MAQGTSRPIWGFNLSGRGLALSLGADVAHWPLCVWFCRHDGVGVLLELYWYALSVLGQAVSIHSPSHTHPHSATGHDNTTPFTDMHSEVSNAYSSVADVGQRRSSGAPHCPCTTVDMCL